MNVNEIVSKSKPVIIIILLFLVAFLIRADAVNINGVPTEYKTMFEDQNGLPYFSEMDSYYNYRMTQDYLNHGYLGDTIQNGTQWDLHSYYPYGRSAEYPPLIAYITGFVYKFVNLFGNIPLNAVAIWTAPFVASLAVIPAYLFVRRITNDYGGIVAGLLVGLAPDYFGHTFAGFFDTDMFNMLFPILVVWFFVESIRAKDIRNRSIFIALSAISMLIYSTAWQQWGYVFYLIVSAGIIYLLVSHLFKMESIKSFKEYPSKVKWFLDQPALFSLVVFVVASAILISIYMGFFGFLNSVTGLGGFTQIQSTVQGTGYPNVYVSVGELRATTFGDILNSNGGILPFIFGILLIPLLIWKLMPNTDNTKKEVKVSKKKSKPRRRTKRTKAKIEDVKTEKKSTVKDPKLMETKKDYILYAVLFSVWLLGTGFLVTKGVRFVEQFAVPMALGAGIFMGLIVPYFKENIKDARYSTLAILAVVALVVYSPVASAYTVSNSEIVPGTADPMYNSLLWIKNNTSPNTVITSWWDFGHLFTATADRPVTFDGGSQNTPRAYWVGRALTTSDENLSAGILRMLTSSGDQGILTLENYTHDTGKSVEILNQILPVDKQTAQTILTTKYNLTLQQAQNVLQYTHPDNPAPHVLLLSSDMLPAAKSGAWSQFGSWNFQNGTGQSYGYYPAAASSSQVNGTTVLQAQNGVVVQIKGNNITAGIQYEQDNQTQMYSPYKLIMVQNGSVVVNKLISNDSSYDIIVVNENNTVVAIVMNKELENSMFTKLFLMNGAGQSKFKLVHKEGGILDPYGTEVWTVS